MCGVDDALAEIRELFEPGPGTIYLDAATYGLPPKPTVAAMHQAIDDWQAGRADWVSAWDMRGEACRSSFGELIGTAPDGIALIPSVSVGVASAMRNEDVLFPSYRDNAALIWRGVKLEEILLFWGGDERGNHFSGPVQDFPFCIPVGSQAPHAAGVAYAFKLRKQPRVAVCLFGDGATSKGDVFEAMNFAGVHKLPVVFVVTNNQWAISVPLRLQTASETLAQKAIAAGFIGEQVDGNDIVAMHAAAEEAIEVARNSRGPRFIEAVTYRLGDHTTADDAARYRPTEEVQARWKEEPIARLRSFLAGQKAWSKTDEEQLSAECQQHIDAAVERYLGVKPRAPETMFDHLYAELPRAYAAQRRELEGND